MCDGSKAIKRQPINFNSLFCAFALLLACTNPATHNDITVDSGKQQDRSDAKTYVYKCSDGYGFVARVQREKVWLFLPEKTISLTHVLSGSGAKYSKDQITYWSKGNEAVLEIGDETHTICKNNRAIAIWEDAKLRGVDFRAIGNEPGWKLEIMMSNKVVFVGNYGQNRYEFITTGPSIDQQTRTTVYKVQNDKHEMSVIIVGRRCRDTMSGEAFETTVTVILDGKKYRGCGKAFH
jgi:membrane-bound inhibitor of C-type lysozyme